MNTQDKISQQIIGLEILEAIKTFEKKINFSKSHIKLINGHFPNTEKHHAHKIEIYTKCIERLNQRLDRLNKAEKQVLDYSKIDNVVLGGVDTMDAPDFCNAYIESADYDGRPMTDKEIESIDSDFIHEKVLEQIY